MANARGDSNTLASHTGGETSAQLRSRVTLAELETSFGKGRSSSQHQRLQAGLEAAASLMANPHAGPG